ncbi:hypothetical protein TNCV_2281221 [Trichonephila clavipes]|nr:hypothetical protein TNCV_2281221 [Trichonephila clavipes]
MFIKALHRPADLISGTAHPCSFIQRYEEDTSAHERTGGGKCAFHVLQTIAQRPVRGRDLEETTALPLFPVVKPFLTVFSPEVVML